MTWHARHSENEREDGTCHHELIRDGFERENKPECECDVWCHTRGLVFDGIVLAHVHANVIGDVAYVSSE